MIEEFGTMPLPVTVSTNPILLVVTVLGDMPVICGNGLSIVNVAAPEVPPPGPEFAMVICAKLPTAKSAAVNVMCNSVELTNVVGRLLWFHWAVEAATNPFPIIVSVVLAAPARVLVGERE